MADLVVTPAHSIIKQSFDCRERLTAGAVPPQLNADGFGAWCLRVWLCRSGVVCVCTCTCLCVGLCALRSCVPVRACACLCVPACLFRACPPRASPQGCFCNPHVVIAGVGWYSEGCNCAQVVSDDSQGNLTVPACTTRHSQHREAPGSGATATAATSTKRHAEQHVAPGVFTSISPAWNNDNLFRLSNKIRSSLVFAHVRAASLGSLVSESNCHPFAVGKYMFMHNGCVGGWGFALVVRRG